MSWLFVPNSLAPEFPTQALGIGVVHGAAGMGAEIPSVDRWAVNDALLNAALTLSW